VAGGRGRDNVPAQPIGPTEGELVSKGRKREGEKALATESGPLRRKRGGVGNGVTGKRMLEDRYRRNLPRRFGKESQ